MGFKFFNQISNIALHFFFYKVYPRQFWGNLKQFVFQLTVFPSLIFLCLSRFSFLILQLLQNHLKYLKLQVWKFSILNKILVLFHNLLLTLLLSLLRTCELVCVVSKHMHLVMVQPNSIYWNALDIQTFLEQYYCQMFQKFFLCFWIFIN